MYEDEEEIVLEEGAVFKRIYDYLPYTHHRIKEILKENCHCYLKPIGGYKCNRVPNYRQEYEIRDLTTDKVINERVNLDTLRRFFAKYDFPLHKSNRNLKAENFLQIVREISDNN